MKDPFLLHIFNPTKNVSPFDVNMAYEAEFDGVIPYSNVTLDEIHALTQDTIFSRGPTGVRRTGIFIGGREFGLAMEMLQRAKAAMVPPFEVSVFVDPSGAITTAAALVACVEAALKKVGHGDLSGKKVHIFGGTGPVGICAGILLDRCGAEAFIASHRGQHVADEVAREYNARFHTRVRGAASGSEEEVAEIVRNSDVLIGSARAGVRVVSHAQLEQARNLKVAADVNAVPPSGIQGVEADDLGRVLNFTPSKALGLGALAIGNVKYKVHYRMFEMMKESERPIYLGYEDAFAVAREYAGRKILGN
ncbi:MAG: methylenetetrahydromethanopterin dehydrogenase [Gammaproteobacteria bacterium]|nr:methylenetetrahydromethanopterin dehydrogenase [Gammaproteobacteria bacterium]